MTKGKALALMLVAFVMLSMPILAKAQTEPTTVTVLGVEIEVTTANAIVALVGGGIVTMIVQFVKKKVAFVADGVGAVVFTVFTTYAVTGIYFLVLSPMHPWVWPKYVVYGLCVFGESTGAYHIYKKAKAALKRS